MFKSKKRPTSLRPTSPSSSSDSKKAESEQAATDESTIIASLKAKPSSTQNKRLNPSSTSSGPSSIGVHNLTESKKTSSFTNNDSTRTNEEETSTLRDHRFLATERSNNTKDQTTNDVTGIYTGSNNYSSIIAKSTSQLASKVSAGPLRANTFVRTMTAFDYAPDVCKDYKTTGFCGFGDTCIFMHERTENSGYEENRERTKKYDDTKVRNEGIIDSFICQVVGGDDDKKGKHDDGKSINKENLPHSCYLCLNHFTSPVQTICLHYFCSSCISDFYKKKSHLCPIKGCGKEMEGVFNYARKLEDLLRKGRWKDFQEMKVVLGKGKGKDDEEDDGDGD